MRNHADHASGDRTFAQQIELMSDTPTDINIINLRFNLAVKTIKIIGEDLAEKLAQESDPIAAEKLEEEAVRHIEAMNGELRILVEAKRRWEARRH